MNTGLVAKNYGCLKDVDVRFSGLHALIGPNDSGKSTILRALRTLSQLLKDRFVSENDVWQPFDPGFAVLPSHAFLSADTLRGTYTFETAGLRPRNTEGVRDGRETVADSNDKASELRAIDEPTNLLGGSDASGWRDEILEHVARVHFLALSEEGLRAASGFMPRDDLSLKTRGEGLPGLYFALRNDREDVFERILQQVRVLFPTVKTVRPQPRSSTALELEVELVGGARVRAPHISTGLLYFLAFAAISGMTERTHTLLVEEPENGLHPARIKEVVAVMRAVSEKQGMQIIMTTHSPLVINELTPDEVSVVTRPSLEHGTVVTPIIKTANFEKRAGVYALGELWLSYADGQTEAPLFSPTVR